MKPYKEWAPTANDARGLNLTELQHWLVAPCCLTRDSDALDRSNWITQNKAIEDFPEEDWQIHRFGHWACGWFEILLVKPNSAACGIAEALEHRLEQYPLLNEDLCSQLEYEEGLDDD